MDEQAFSAWKGKKKRKRKQQEIRWLADNSERNERYKPHGHNENAKKDGRENVFSRRLFSFSPDAQHPAGGWKPPSPWGMT